MSSPGGLWFPRKFHVIWLKTFQVLQCNEMFQACESGHCGKKQACDYRCFLQAGVYWLKKSEFMGQPKQTLRSKITSLKSKYCCMGTSFNFSKYCLSDNEAFSEIGTLM